MKNKIIKIIVLQFLIILTFFSITNYIFFNYKPPDPVGTGLQQAALTLLDFIITLIVCVFLIVKAKNKKQGLLTLAVNIFSIFFWIIIYVLLEDKISNYLF